MKENKIKILIITISVLAVLLLGSIAYIIYDKYQQKQTEEKFGIYQQGAEFGYQQAVLQIMQQMATCQQVPVTYNNQTLHAIAAECLQK